MTTDIDAVTILYMATDSRFTRTYDSASEAIMHVGPTLQDYVTPTELDALIDGTLAPAVIADRYYDDMGIGEPYGAQVATDDAETRADLLGFVRNEIEIAMEQRREDGAEAALQELREQDMRTGTLIATALRNGATKKAVAEALDISRPTLDKLISEQQDRARFNDAIELLTKHGRRHANETSLYALLGVHSVVKQAWGVRQAVDELDEGDWAQWSEVRRDFLLGARSRADELIAARG